MAHPSERDTAEEGQQKMIHQQLRSGKPINVLEGAVVDARAGADLLSATADLAASVLEVSLGRSERLARAERATEAADGIARWVHVLDPYRDGVHARLVDLIAASGHQGFRDVPAGEAKDRLAIARSHDFLALQTRAGVDLSGLNHTAFRAPSVALPDAFPLLQLAEPMPLGVGPARTVPGPWTEVPDAVTGWDTEPAGSVPQLAEIPADTKTARWSFNVSHQEYTWAVDFAREFELLAAHQVRTSLETQLVAQLVAGAAAAADLEAAEVAIGGVWPAGPSLVLTAGVDLPAVRRAYALDFPDPSDRPAIRGTFGLTPGSVLVLALPGVRVEATPVQWNVAESPRVLGREVGAYADGRAAVRIPGAVQLVTLAP